MIYNWYKIANLQTFEATGLVSQELELELQDLGTKKILLTKGNVVGVTYEGVFLPVSFEGMNPFEFDGHAVFLDSSSNIYLGIENAS